MHKFVNWGVRAILAFLSLESLVAVADWSGRLEWLQSMINAHPLLGTAIRGPLFPLICLILCVLFVYGERWLRQPRIVARFINSRTVPNFHTVTMRDILDTEAKKPGWDKRKLDWWWFVEVKLVNDSDTQVTIEDIKTHVRVGRRVEQASICEDLGYFKADMGYDADLNNKSWSGEQYRPLASLREAIKNVPLARGVGYRGWLRLICGK